MSLLLELSEFDWLTAEFYFNLTNLLKQANLQYILLD